MNWATTLCLATIDGDFEELSKGHRFFCGILHDFDTMWQNMPDSCFEQDSGSKHVLSKMVLVIVRIIMLYAV